MCTGHLPNPKQTNTTTTIATTHHHHHPLPPQQHDRIKTLKPPPGFEQFRQTYGKLDLDEADIGGTGWFTEDPDEVPQLPKRGR